MESSSSKQANKKRRKKEEKTDKQIDRDEKAMKYYDIIMRFDALKKEMKEIGPYALDVVDFGFFNLGKKLREEREAKKERVIEIFKELRTSTFMFMVDSKNIAGIVNEYL